MSWDLRVDFQWVILWGIYCDVHWDGTWQLVLGFPGYPAGVPRFLVFGDVYMWWYHGMSEDVLGNSVAVLDISLRKKKHWLLFLYTIHMPTGVTF